MGRKGLKESMGQKITIFGEQNSRNWCKKSLWGILERITKLLQNSIF